MRRSGAEEVEGTRVDASISAAMTFSSAASARARDEVGRPWPRETAEGASARPLRGVERRWSGLPASSGAARVAFFFFFFFLPVGEVFSVEGREGERKSCEMRIPEALAPSILVLIISGDQVRRFSEESEARKGAAER